MGPLRTLGSWLRAIVAGRSLEREIDEELRAHLEHEIDALRARGVPRPEAERRARARFGSLTTIREECREARGTRWLDAMFQDLRYAMRVLGRAPMFALTVVLTLAFTVGAVTTVITLLDSFYLSTWPVEAPEEIVEVRATREQGTRTGPVSWADYESFRDGATTLEPLVAVYPTAPLHLDAGGEVFDVTGAAVTADTFPMLGLTPALGRFFVAAEDRVPGRDRVAVLGHAFWRRWFGEDPDVLGRELVVNGVRFEVIGVAPAAFRGFDAQPVDLYLPTMMLGTAYRWCDVLGDPDCTILRMYGRRASGVDIETVRAEMESLVPDGWRQPDRSGNTGITVRDVRGYYLSDTESRFVGLLGWVAALLFGVCCANLAGLMIARQRARAGELAVRASLGAGAWRLARQLATEGLLLAVAGSTLGLVLARTFTRALERRFYLFDSSGRPLAYAFELSPTVLAAVVALATLGTLLFGLLPAIGVARRVAGTAGSAIGARLTARPHAWLLGLQAGGAVALVVLASLLATSSLAAVDVAGVDSDRVALLRLRPRLMAYEPARAQTFVREVIAALEAHPAVESASMVGTGIALLGFDAEVGLPGESGPAGVVGYMEVGPRYFETLGTPVLRGREFRGADDGSGAPVAVVSTALAQRLWPDGNALGRILRVDGREREVVGVVADVALQPRSMQQQPYVYVPFWQNPEQVDARLQVRVTGDPAALLPELVELVREVDPGVPVTETLTLDRRLAGMFRPVRMSATTIVYAGGLATLLAALGLYASLAGSVARRTREIGVRQAIGATAPDILRMVTAEGLRLTLVGGLAGAAAAWWASRLLRHMLYAPASSDPLGYGLALALIVLVATAASWLPARRAARVDPVRALRAE